MGSVCSYDSNSPAKQDIEVSHNARSEQPVGSGQPNNDVNNDLNKGGQEQGNETVDNNVEVEVEVEVEVPDQGDDKQEEQPVNIVTFNCR